MKKTLLCLLTAFVLTSFAFSCNTATNKNSSSSSNNEQYTDTVTVNADFAEDFTVSKVFSDDMVIQENRNGNNRPFVRPTDQARKERPTRRR